MIKEPENLENLKLNVYLKNGGEYLGRDITKKPFGESERVVGFWDKTGTTLILIPMTEVKMVEMYFEKPC